MFRLVETSRRSPGLNNIPWVCRMSSLGRGRPVARRGGVLPTGTRAWVDRSTAAANVLSEAAGSGQRSRAPAAWSSTGPAGRSFGRLWWGSLNWVWWGSSNFWWRERASCSSYPDVRGRQHNAQGVRGTPQEDGGAEQAPRLRLSNKGGVPCDEQHFVKEALGCAKDDLRAAMRQDYNATMKRRGRVKRKAKVYDGNSGGWSAKGKSPKARATRTEIEAGSGSNAEPEVSGGEDAARRRRGREDESGSRIYMLSDLISKTRGNF